MPFVVGPFEGHPPGVIANVRELRQNFGVDQNLVREQVPDNSVEHLPGEFSGRQLQKNPY